LLVIAGGGTLLLTYHLPQRTAHSEVMQ